MVKETSKKSPQIGVRFPQEDMDHLRAVAERDYAGSISTLVKVAVMRLIGKPAERNEADRQAA